MTAAPTLGKTEQLHFTHVDAFLSLAVPSAALNWSYWRDGGMNWERSSALAASPDGVISLREATRTLDFKLIPVKRES